MIDASRLSQSLATALKDRPHGIPVQPNRSLPLRPAPPLPIRKSVPKCPENSPSKSTMTKNVADKKKESSNERESVIRECSISQSSDSPSRINFYDAANDKNLSNDESVHTNEKTPQRVSGELVKVRNTKSLDTKDCDESARNEKRRKSWEYGGDAGNGKKMNISNLEPADSVHGVKTIRDRVRADVAIKKRKSTSAEEELRQDTPRQDKVAKIQNSDELITDTRGGSSLQQVNSSGTVFPNIIRYRISETNASSEVDKTSEKLDKFGKLKRRRSSNILKPISPKSQYLPECPRAVPIEIAHAINQSDMLNSKINTKTNDADILNSQAVNDALANYQSDSMKPKINTRTEDSYTLRIEELVSPSLPSMPNLEDGQTDPFAGLLVLPEEEINSAVDGSDLLSEPTIKITAKVSQTESKIEEKNVRETIANAPRSKDVEKLDEPLANESISNVTTVLEIKIPGRSPELIIVQTPQLVSAEKLDNIIGDNSPVEATTPVSLSSSVQSASDEPRNNEEIESIGALDEPIEIGSENLGEYAIPTSNDPQEEALDILGKDKALDLSNVSTLPDTGESREEEKKVVNKSLEISQEHQRMCRKNRLCQKLQKLYEEETHLRNKLSQTSDPMRVKRLQQKVNCTEKKIENTKKHLDKLVSNDRVKFQGRIQVRRDLVGQKQSPQSEEPISNRSLQLNSQIDEISIEKTGPIVITILDTDSSLLSEENSGTNSDVKPFNDVDGASVQPQVELECGLENDASESGAIVGEIPSQEDAPENSGDTVAVNPEINGASSEEDERLTNTEDRGGVTDVQTAEELAASNAAPEITNGNVEYADKKSIENFESSPPAVAPEPLKKAPPPRENITPISIVRSTSVYSNDNLPAAQPLGAPNFNAWNCTRCSRNGIPPTAVKKVVASPVADNFIPSTVTEHINGIPNRQTVVQENPNAHPASNYPVHRTDYRTTTGTVSGTFSRDNGGANSNLSSPLQGHSALPLPPPYGRNLTAQGYPPAPEMTQNHYQTTQWYNNHQPASKSSPSQYTIEQEGGFRSPVLAAHLLMPQVQEPANLSRSTKTTSPPQNNETNQLNYEQNITARIMTEQFPTLGNWAAAQMSKESVGRKPTVGMVNTNLKVNQIAGYKSSESDLYKMAATAIEVTPHSSLPEAITPIWGSARPAAHPAEHQRIMVPGFPDPRNNPNLYPRDYPVVNTQNYHQPNNQNGAYNVKTGYAGSELITPYIIHTTHRQHNNHQQVPSGAQMVHNSGCAEYSVGQQKTWQYRQAPETALFPQIWFNSNNSKHGNPIGMLPQQYLQQQHQRERQQRHRPLAQPAPAPPPPYRQIQPRSQIKPAVVVSKKYNRRNSNVSVNGQKKQSENPAGCYQQPNINSAMQVQRQHSAANSNIVPAADVRLSNPIQNMHAMYNSVLQDERAAEPMGIGKSSAAYNSYSIFHPNHGTLQLTNASKCLRCGMPAPKFNCADCEIAFYCNEFCQRDHWATHSLECRKRMPKLKKVN